MPNNKTLSLSPELLETLLKRPREFHQEMIDRNIRAIGMPEDAKIVGCEWKEDRMIVLQIQSASFLNSEPMDVWFAIEPLKQAVPDANGFTKDGEIAGDYLDAGRDPNLPRHTQESIERALEQAEPYPLA